LALQALTHSLIPHLSHTLLKQNSRSEVCGSVLTGAPAPDGSQGPGDWCWPWGTYSSESVLSELALVARVAYSNLFR